MTARGSCRTAKSQRVACALADLEEEAMKELSGIRRQKLRAARTQVPSLGRLISLQQGRTSSVSREREGTRPRTAAMMTRGIRYIYCSGTTQLWLHVPIASRSFFLIPTYLESAWGHTACPLRCLLLLVTC